MVISRSPLWDTDKLPVTLLLWELALRGKCSPSILCRWNTTLLKPHNKTFREAVGESTELTSLLNMGSRPQSPSGTGPVDLSIPRHGLRRDSMRSRLLRSPPIYPDHWIPCWYFSSMSVVSDVEMARNEVCQIFILICRLRRRSWLALGLRWPNLGKHPIQRCVIRAPPCSSRLYGELYILSGRGRLRRMVERRCGGWSKRDWWRISTWHRGYRSRVNQGLFCV